MLLQCSLLFMLSFLKPGFGEVKSNIDQRTLVHFVRDPYFRVNETSRIPPMWYRPSIPNINEIPREFKIPSSPKYFPEYTVGTELNPKYTPKISRGRRSPGMKKHRTRYIYI